MSGPPLDHDPDRSDATQSFAGAAAREGHEEDQRLVAALDEYVAALERGEAEPVEDYVERHKELGSELVECLEGVRVLHAAVESARDREEGGPGHGRLGAALSDSDPGSDSDPSIAEGAPRVIGDYRIVREIGRGGMGVVYEAQEQSLRRRVALKVLPFAAVLDQRQIARFRNEAQAAAGLHHANIVPVYAIGQERGVHYYAMQYIEGRSVAQAITELRREAGAGASPDATTETAAISQMACPTPATPLSLGASGELGGADGSLDRNPSKRSFFHAAAWLAADAADALQHAHDLGVVHRDVKPSNLLIDERGKVWVADFGLARMQTDLGVTATGDVVGTLRYMSPEQARGRADRVDGRTDVYALGATLYELLTLQQAFPGNDRVRMLEQLQRFDPVSPRRLNPAIPPDLENIVLRAMEKDRDARYASAGELRDDLRRYLDGRPTIARPPSVADQVGKWMRRRRKTVTVAAVAMAVVAVVSLASAVLVNQARQRLAVALAESEVHLDQTERALEHSLGVLNRFGSELSVQLAAIPGAEAVSSEALQETLDAYRYFLKELEDVPQWTSAAAQTRIRAAAVVERLGRPDEALTLYEQAAESLENLIEQDPSDAESASWLARCLTNHGLLLAQQKTPGASDELGVAVEIRRGVLAESPADPTRMADLAATLSDAAALEADDPQSAQRRLEEAVVLLGRARRVEPDNSGHTRRLAVAHNALASLLRVTDPTRAGAESDRAVEQLVALTDAEPEVDAYRDDLAMAYSNRGALAADRGDWAEAGDAYAAAAKELRRLAERSPLLPRRRTELAVALASQGAALALAGRRSASDDAFDEARRTLEGLVASYPAADRYSRSLAALWNNQGVVLRDSGRLDEASHAFARAVAIEERRLEESGTPGPTLLAMHYANHAQLLGRLGKLSEAAEVQDKRQALIERTGAEGHLSAGKEKTR